MGLLYLTPLTKQRTELSSFSIDQFCFHVRFKLFWKK